MLHHPSLALTLLLELHITVSIVYNCIHPVLLYTPVFRMAPSWEQMLSVGSLPPSVGVLLSSLLPSVALSVGSVRWTTALPQLGINKINPVSLVE